jgi:hypothetical protein
MGALDSVFKDLASTLIGALVSNTATLVRAVAADYDPTTGEELNAAVESYSVRITPPEKFDIKEIDGSSILQHDLRTYIAAKDLTTNPETRKDTLSFGNVVYNVVKVTPHYSGDEVCLWELQLRS